MPNKQPRELLLFSRAERALAEADSVDEVRDIRNQAEVARAYARKARLGQKLVVEASVIKLRAERRLGQILSALDLPRGGAPKQKGKNPSLDDRGSASLGELGIGKLGQIGSCTATRWEFPDKTRHLA